MARNPLAVALFGPAAKELVRLLLEAGASTEGVTDQGHSILTLAVAMDKLDLVQMLASHPAVDVNARDGVGQNPLTRAVRHRRAAIVEWLLDHPAVDKLTKTSEEGANLLHVACWNPPSAKMMDILLQRPELGLDVNGLETTGLTPLMEAVNGRQAGQVVKMLLATPGVDINVVDESGRFALRLAVANPSEEALQALLDHGLSRAPHARGPYSKEDSHEFLHVAAEARNMLAVQQLLEVGADVNSRGDAQWTPLTCAARRATSKVPDTAATVALLLDKGADPSLVDEFGRTAVAHAVRGCSLAAFGVFRERGLVDPSWVDREGWSLAHCAAIIGTASDGTQFGTELVRAMMRALVPLGLDWNLRCSEGFTPLLRAAENASARPLRALCAWSHVPGVQLHMSAQDNEGRTALMLAAGPSKSELGSMETLLAMA